MTPDSNQPSVYRPSGENQGNLTMAWILAEELLLILSAHPYVREAKALSVRGEFSGIYRGSDMMSLF